MVYLILAGLVLAAITIRAMRKAPPMPEAMAEAEEWSLVYTQRIIYQRPLSERLGDTGGEL